MNKNDPFKSKNSRKYPKKWDHHKEEIIIDGLVLFKIIFKKDKKKDLD